MSFTQPDFTAQDAATYKTNLDNALAYLKGVDRKQNLLPVNLAEVMSNGTLLDVTTGAAPVQTGAEAALVAGGSIVVNGGVDSDASGYVTADVAVASVAGGETGNCLEVTNTAAAYGQSYLAIAVEVGKTYAFSARFKKGTSGSGKIRVGSAPSNV